MVSASKYLSAEERRTMAVKAVLDLAAVQNPHDISTTAIAARMGLSQGGIFRHFSSKDEIWRTVMTWVATELYSRVSAAGANQNKPLDALEAMFIAHLNFAIEYPGVPRILFGELQKPETTAAKVAVVELLEKYGKLLVLTLEQGKLVGEIGAEVNSRIAASLFIGAIQSLLIRALLHGNMDLITQDALQTFDIFRRGIRSIA